MSNVIARVFRRGQGLRVRPRAMAVESLERRTLFAVFNVNVVDDAGLGSLRAAIDDANLNPGQDTITFTIMTGAQTIALLSPLSPLTDAAGVIIAGETQPSFTNAPLITLDGAGAGAGAIGLELASGSNLVQSLIVQNFPGDQIQTSGAGTNNIFLGNRLFGGGAGASDGLQIGTPGTRVGGGATADRNFISNLAITAGDDSVIENNAIGVNVAGTGALPNAGGVFVTTALRTVIVSNVISGNSGAGIALMSASSTVIQNNLIGTTEDGLTALSNGGVGVSLDNSASVAILSNVISANTGGGITVAPGSNDANIRLNSIGADGPGAAGLGNGQEGIIVSGADDAVIIANTISDNIGDGITLEDGATGAFIFDNRIGTDAGGVVALGNGGNGVTVGASSGAAVTGTRVGGQGAGEGNTIAFNSGTGVSVVGSGDTGNAIARNSIFSNGLLGIDLGTVGRTANDDNDPDTGANTLQNFPTLVQAIFVAGGGTAVAGSFESTPSTAFRLEFFQDPSGSAPAAEGRMFLGSANVTTDANGFVTFNAMLPTTIVAGQFVTATATNPSGNTSEFSDTVVAGVRGPDLIVSGNGITIVSGDTTPSTVDATDFGSITLGTGSISKTFIVTNGGAATVNISGAQITGGGGQFAITTPPTSTLAPNASGIFTITFTPSAAGNQTATVSISSNDPVDIPYTFAISGQGLAVVPAPEIEISGNGNPIANGDVSPSSPDDTDLGTAGIGDTPVSSTFSITNAGAIDLTLGTVSITGGDGQFSVQNQPGSTTVAPGQSTTFTVQFSPDSGGQFSAVVNVTSNDSDENPYQFGIRGTGVPGGGTRPVAALLPADQQPAPIRNDIVYEFIVRYTDDQGISVGTFDNGDLIVTLPDNSTQAAEFVRVGSSTTGQADAVYRIAAPGGTLDPSDDGTYTVALRANQVADSGGLTALAAEIGSFTFSLTTARTLRGTFGVVNGRKQKLQLAEIDGTVVTLTLTNGTARAITTPTNRLDFEVDSIDGKLTITTRNGNNRAELNDIRVTGSLKTFTAKTGDLAGFFDATQGLGAITLGSASGATISTPSPITSLVIKGNMSSTQVFSGADLGDDGRFGGTGIDADDFGAGQIMKKFQVGGSITSSLIAAGLDPVDSILLNDNGIIVGGAASLIKSINVRGTVDASTVFAAGAFPTKAKIGGLSIFPASDQRFDTTP